MDWEKFNEDFGCSDLHLDGLDLGGGEVEGAEGDEEHGAAPAPLPPTPSAPHHR